MTSLFKLGGVRLAGGDFSMWKVECDALTPDDWAALAYMAVERFSLTFGRVEGIPTGGEPFAKALRPYASPLARRVLVVDDVYTTGSSYDKYVERYRWMVTEDHDLLVAFARGPFENTEKRHALWRMA